MCTATGMARSFRKMTGLVSTRRVAITQGNFSNPFPCTLHSGWEREKIPSEQQLMGKTVFSNKESSAKNNSHTTQL